MAARQLDIRCATCLPSEKLRAWQVDPGRAATASERSQPGGLPVLAVLRRRFVLRAVAEFPFGKGRYFNIQSCWLDLLAGGWNINTIYTYQTGAPAFNTSAFDTKSADQFAFHIRTFSATFGNLRQDGINEWSPSVTKRFIINEKIYFQLRGEAYNVFNHVAFAAPNTTATNSGFGLITSQAQLGARFVF